MLGNLAKLRSYLGDHAGAADRNRHALEIARRHGLPASEVRLLVDQAHLYERIGAPEQSREFACEAYVKSDEVEAAELKALALTALGKAHAAAREWEDAATALRKVCSRWARTRKAPWWGG